MVHPYGGDFGQGSWDLFLIKDFVVQQYGLFDENLAPFGHDDLDLSIRLNKKGYKNAIFGVKFKSLLDWGGTRTPKDPNKDYCVNYNNIVFSNIINEPV